MSPGKRIFAVFIAMKLALTVSFKLIDSFRYLARRRNRRLNQALSKAIFAFVVVSEKRRCPTFNKNANPGDATDGLDSVAANKHNFTIVNISLCWHSVVFSGAHQSSPSKTI